MEVEQLYKEVKKIVMVIAGKYTKKTGFHIDTEMVAHDAAVRVSMRLAADPGYIIKHLYTVSKHAFLDELGQRKSSRRGKRAEVMSFDVIPEDGEQWPEIKQVKPVIDPLQAILSGDKGREALVFIWRHKWQSSERIIKGVAKIAGDSWTITNGGSIIRLKKILRGDHGKAAKKRGAADGKDSHLQRYGNGGKIPGDV